MGDLATKRQARAVARAYLAEMLRSDDMPEWPIEKGYFADDDFPAMDEFLEELRRIAGRLERSIPPAGRAFLKATQHQEKKP